MAGLGLSVHIIDADPQQHSALAIYRMAVTETGEKPVGGAPTWTARGVTVVRGVGEDDVSDAITAAAAVADVVLVDLQGAASQAMIFAMAQSDLVLIVTQPSGFDEAAVRRTAQICANAAKVARREIPVRVLMNRTSAGLNLKIDAHIRDSLIQSGLECLFFDLKDRAWLRQMTVTGQVPKVGAKDKAEHSAAVNIANLTKEVLAVVNGKGEQFYASLEHYLSLAQKETP